jgi:hypothetical protein
LGTKLEDFTKEILQADGYTLRGPVKLKGKSGATVEIDIVAEKTHHDIKLKIAVECKNYTKPVPPADVRDFIYKMGDAGFDQGLFVTNHTFLEEAKKLAEENKVWTWDLDKLKEKIILSKTGRLGVDQSYKFLIATPLHIDFPTATRLDNIKNYLGRVEVSSAKLIWKPYYVITYRLDAFRKDPAKKMHSIRDSGDCVINAIDGDVIKFMHTRDVSNLILRENTEDDVLTKQLEIKLINDYKVESSDEYDVKKIEPGIDKDIAKKISLLEIINKNTRDIQCEIESKDSITGYELKRFKFIPKSEEVTIISTRLVFVPKWEVKFASGKYEYIREMAASSGEIIVDTMFYCPDHFFRELLKIFRKKTIAVCEICGKALCAEHIHQCPVCKKWLGVEHSLKCKNCGRFFCEEHIHKACHICSGPICEDCIIQCLTCGGITCKDDMVKCERCERKMCRSCAIPVKKLLVFTRFLCKECAD